ncbi:hypothetical protein COOONC_20530 [Cooperia oncophora]
MAGADVNYVDPSASVSAMQEAVAAGNAHLINLFINQLGCLFHPENTLQNFSISAAYQLLPKHRSLDIVLPLLLPLDGMKTATTALVEGARNGHEKCVRYLLAQNWRKPEERTAAIDKAMVAAAGAGEKPIFHIFRNFRVVAPFLSLHSYCNAMEKLGMGTFHVIRTGDGAYTCPARDVFLLSTI